MGRRTSLAAFDIRPWSAIVRDRVALRVAVVTLAVVFFAFYGYAQTIGQLRQGYHADLGQVWFAARAVLHGQDPYPLIGPGRTFNWLNGFYYPLPAALLLIPLAPFPEPIAVSIFSAVGGGVFAYALTRYSFGPLWALGSACAVHAFEIGQWAPLLAGATVIAPLGVVLIAKPTVGAAVFAAKPTRWAVFGGLTLIVLSFMLQPHWVHSWRESLQETSVRGGGIPYTVPIMFPAGVLALLALLRWRRPEARLLAVMACVPQTALPYEGLLLFLVPRGWRESLTLTGLSWAMLWYVRYTFVLTEALPTALIAYAHAMVPFLYLPATIMVLRRPNEGARRDDRLGSRK